MKLSQVFMIKIGLLLLISAVIFLAWDWPLIKRINGLYRQQKNQEATLAAAEQQGNSFTKALLDYESYSAQIPACTELFRRRGQELDLIFELEKLAAQSGVKQKLDLAESASDFNEQIIQLPLIMELTGSYNQLYNYLNELKKMNLQLAATGLYLKQPAPNAENIASNLEAKVLAQTFWLKENANCD